MRRGLLCAGLLAALLVITSRVDSSSPPTEAKRLVFLADTLRSRVVVFDASRSRILAALPTLRPSRRVLADRSNNRLYVANTGWLTSDTVEAGSVTIWDLPKELPSDDDSSPAGAFLDRAEVRAHIETGIAPAALALDKDTLFVANAGDGTVSVVDVERAAEVSKFYVGGIVSGLAVDKTAGALYAARRDTDAVVVLSQSDGTILATVPVGRQPSDVIVTSDDAVLVANTGDGTVSIVDPRSFEVRGTITTNGGPFRLLPEGHEGLVVADTIFGGLSALDLGAKRVTASMQLSHGLADVTMEGGEAFALTFKHGDVYALDRSVTQIRAFVRPIHVPTAIASQVGY